MLAGVMVCVGQSAYAVCSEQACSEAGQCSRGEPCREHTQYGFDSEFSSDCLPWPKILPPPFSALRIRICCGLTVMLRT